MFRLIFTEYILNMESIPACYTVRELSPIIGSVSRKTISEAKSANVDQPLWNSRFAPLSRGLHPIEV
jgi:hypothetical protein